MVISRQKSSGRLERSSVAQIEWSRLAPYKAWATCPALQPWTRGMALARRTRAVLMARLAWGTPAYPFFHGSFHGGRVVGGVWDASGAPKKAPDLRHHAALDKGEGQMQDQRSEIADNIDDKLAHQVKNKLMGSEPELQHEEMDKNCT